MPKERGGQGNISDAGHHLAPAISSIRKKCMFWSTSSHLPPIPLPPCSGQFPCHPSQLYQGPLRTHCQLHTCTPAIGKFYTTKKNAIFQQFIPLFCGKKNIQFSVVCGASWWSPSLSPQRLSGSIATTEAPKHNSLLRQVALAVSSPWLRVKLQPHWKTVRGNFYIRKTWQNRSA